jgi:TnsA endonuclease N terminal
LYTPIPMKRSTHYGNNYWEGFSPKLKRNVRFFSDLEYEHWILVETNPLVETFCEQPLRIRQCLNGEWVESIFDMWIKDYDGNETFVEVKYSEELEPNHKNYARVKRQTTAQMEWCRSNGKKHVIQTERDIRGNRIYLENMRYLLPFVRQHKNSDEIAIQITELLKKGSLTIAKVQTTLSIIPVRKIRECIYCLLYEGILCSENMHYVPLGKQTVVKYHE